MSDKKILSELSQPTKKNSTATKTLIAEWLEDPSTFQTWITQKNKEDTLTTLNQTFVAMLDHWGDWSEHYNSEKLMAFIIHAIEIANKYLVELEQYSPPNIAKCVTAILSNSLGLLSKSSAWQELDSSSPKSSSQVFDVFLQRSLALLTTPQHGTSSLPLRAFQLSDLTQLLQHDTTLSFAAFINRVAHINSLAEARLVSFGRTLVNLEWLEQKITAIKLHPSDAAQLLKFYAVLAEKFGPNLQITDATLDILLRSLVKQGSSAEIIFSGLQSIGKILALRRDLNATTLLKNLEQHFNFLVSPPNDKKEVKQLKVFPTDSCVLLQKVKLIEDIFQLINDRSNVICPLSVEILKNLLQAVLDQAEQLSQQDINELMVSIGRIQRLGRSHASDKAQLQPLLKELAEIGERRADSLDLSTTSRALYSLFVSDYKDIKGTKKLTAHYSALLIPDNSGNEQAIKLAHQGAHYFAENDIPLPEHAQPYINASAPLVKRNKRQHGIAKALREKDWFVQGNYSCSTEKTFDIPRTLDKPGKPGIDFTDLCITDKNDENWVFEFDDAEDHLEGTPDEKKDRLRWKDEVRDNRLRNLKDHEGKPVIKKLHRIPLWPPHRSDLETILEIIKQVVLGPVEEKKRLVSSAPTLKMASSEMPLTADDKEKPSPTPIATEPVVEKKSRRSKAKKKKKPKKPDEPVRLPQLLKAVKGLNLPEVTALMRRKLEMDNAQKALVLISILEKNTSPHYIEILKIVCEGFSAEITGSTTVEGTSPIVRAVELNLPDAIKHFIDKTPGKMKPPVPEEWQKALKLATDKKYQPIADNLKDKGVTVPVVPPTIPSSAPGLKKTVSQSVDEKNLGENKLWKDMLESNHPASCECWVCWFRKDMGAVLPDLDLSKKPLQPISLQEDSLSQLMMAYQFFNQGDNIHCYWWMLRAAEGGNYPAQLALIRNGNITKNHEQEFKWAQLAANHGRPAGQYDLGNCYHTGTGVPKDGVMAVAWYQLAADQGYPEAQYALGDCYYKGFGVKQDGQEAVRWFKKAADQNFAPAQHRLGLCYMAGIGGLTKDKKEAFRYCQLAAEQGDVEAQDYVGACYYYGGIVDRDKKQAANWFRKAADQKLAKAQDHLGVCYANGVGVPKDAKEAVKYYRLAADQGLAVGQNHLGLCYEDGIGVPKDAKEAVKYYRLAADQGLAVGQNHLGLCYANGVGVPKDAKEAVKYYRLAADQGLAVGQNHLGLCYEAGIGVQKDTKEAVKYYRLAADQGFVGVQEHLGRCYAEGIGVPKDKKRAFHWRQLAAKQGIGESQLYMGKCYLHGWGVEQDLKEAETWLRLAAAHQKPQKIVDVANLNLEFLFTLSKMNSADVMMDAKKLLQMDSLDILTGRGLAQNPDQKWKGALPQVIATIVPRLGFPTPTSTSSDRGQVTEPKNDNSERAKPR